LAGQGLAANRNGELVLNDVLSDELDLNAKET